MADYEAGEVTERERLAANRLTEIARKNADAIRNQLERSIANYDMADTQNKALLDKQFGQIGRKTEADRFEGQRGLRNAALGLFGAMGPAAYNGSAIGNAMYMLRDRNDADNSVQWEQQQENRNQAENAYDESRNQNTLGVMDAVANAEKALYDSQNDLAANLNNANPNLYIPGGEGEADLGASTLYDQYKRNPNLAQLSGYLMPEDAEQQVVSKRNKVQNNSSFSNLLNRFNRRL